MNKLPMCLSRDKNPPAETHMIVAGNGLYLHKQMPWIDATVPVGEVSSLPPVQASAKLLLPPLPVRIISRALRLAKNVYDKSRSEVCLLLHHNEGKGYRLTVPRQTVSADGIEYDATQRLKDFLCVGTIHSHGAYSAFHSPTDLADEEFSDGVHITLGDIGSYPRFSLSAEIVVNQTRFPLDLSWFLGLTKKDRLYRVDKESGVLRPLPKRWTQAITHDKLLTERRQV